MNTHFTRIIDRWVDTHPVYGVRVLLAALPTLGTDDTDLRIGAARFPITVYNDVDDECMFPRYNPTEVPALGIVANTTMPSPVVARRGQLDYNDVEIGLSYLERDQPELLSRRRGDYVLTAVALSLIAFNDVKISKVPIAGDVLGDTWRSLGGDGAVGSVEVQEITMLERFRVNMGVHNVRMYGALIATCRVRQVV